MPNRIDVHLSPGSVFAGDARHRVHTLLGSCVSITLWHPQRRFGAMSHFLLAQRTRSRAARAEAAAADALDARYGDEALALMLAALAAQGIAARECEAKLFGGGNMFPQHAAPVAVGRRNGDAARALLAEQGIAPVSHSLFGVGHRSIVFDVATGDVWSRGGELLQAQPAAPAATVPAPLAPRAPRTGMRR